MQQFSLDSGVWLRCHLQSRFYFDMLYDRAHQPLMWYRTAPIAYLQFMSRFSRLDVPKTNLWFQTMRRWRYYITHCRHEQDQMPP